MLDFGFYNMDCMEGMKQFPDNYFDLAIVDPPYGGAGAPVDETFNGAISGGFGGRFKEYFNGDKRGHMCGGHAKKYNYASWDVVPDETYFKELFRVSKNQIIWGGQLFLLTADKMLSRVEKAHSRKLFDGNVRVCVDFIQRKCKSV